MKKNKFAAVALGAIMCIPLALGVSACGKKTDPVSVSSKEVYAMSAFSSMEYLENMQKGTSTAKATATGATTRPTTISDEDVKGAKDCLTMFDEILQNNGFTQTTTKNTDTTEGLADYTFVMQITLPNLQGSKAVKLYYNEKETTTNIEIDDEEEEVEVSTTLEGVLVSEDAQYRVTGERTVETEGKETETTIKFTTYLDENNYIIVEQEVEDNEIEYEYKIYQNGVKVQDIEIELEKKNGKTELEYELVDLTTGIRKKTAYKLKTIDNMSFEIKLQRNQSETSERFTATLVEGQLTFTYANGYSETV